MRNTLFTLVIFSLITFFMSSGILAGGGEDGWPCPPGGDGGSGEDGWSCPPGGDGPGLVLPLANLPGVILDVYHAML